MNANCDEIELKRDVQKLEKNPGELDPIFRVCGHIKAQGGNPG